MWRGEWGCETSRFGVSCLVIWSETWTGSDCVTTVTGSGFWTGSESRIWIGSETGTWSRTAMTLKTLNWNVTKSDPCSESDCVNG